MILLILFAIYLILIASKKIDNSKTEPFLGRYYAHRGLFNNKSTSPENSLLAFQLAVERDYGIELDVQLTKDNIPIVFHDYDLNRVCKIDREISESTFDELKSINLYDSNQKIPTLESVLNLVDGKVPLIIELKGEDIDDSLCKTISPILDKYKGTYAIESFNPYLLSWFKKNSPDLIRGQLAKRMNKEGQPIFEKIKNFALENLLFNFISKPHFIAFDYRDKDMVSFNLSKKIYKPLLVAYTIQSQDTLDKNKNEFDLFIFDGFIPE